MGSPKNTFGISFESGDLEDPEFSQFLDASVAEHIQAQKAKKQARATSKQKAKQLQAHAERAGIFKHSSQGMLICVTTGKNAYDSELAAKEAASYIKAERDIALKVYRCDECHKWHLTSKE